MYNLSEARLIQAKAQKKAVFKFFIGLSITLIVTLLIEFCTDIVQEHRALRLLPLLFLLAVLKFSDFLIFFRKKEFHGKILKVNVELEQSKKYLSHQAGVAYATEKKKIMTLLVADQKNKTMMYRFPYNKNWHNLKEGDEVIILRFVRDPVICK